MSKGKSWHIGSNHLSCLQCVELVLLKIRDSCTKN
jgi:hypothetical protein